MLFASWFSMLSRLSSLSAQTLRRKDRRRRKLMATSRSAEICEARVVLSAAPVVIVHSPGR